MTADSIKDCENNCRNDMRCIGTTMNIYEDYLNRIKDVRCYIKYDTMKHGYQNLRISAKLRSDCCSSLGCGLPGMARIMI